MRSASTSVITDGSASARPNAIATVNVVATFAVLASFIPVYFAQRITDATSLS